jgi:hypothetical protein
MGWLVAVYIAATIFGVGVTLVDLLGFLGHGGGHAAGSHDAMGHDAAGHDAQTDHGSHGSHDQPAHSQLPAGTQQQGSVLSHQPRRRGLNLGLRALTAARTLVYFSFGFGPIGWIAFSMHPSHIGSLLWSLPAGALFAAAGLSLRRIQGSVLDSQVREEELLMEKAEVIVPIAQGRIGKVRATLGGRFVERYARAVDGTASFPTGATVRIVSITEECVLVTEA